MRILIVDDQIEILEILHDLLNKPGCRIDVADSCAGALALVGKHVYDWAVLDYRLADGTGLQVQAAIRQAGHDTRILFVTGDAGDRLFEKTALPLGAEAVLPKPIFADRLVACIHGPIRQWDR